MPWKNGVMRKPSSISCISEVMNEGSHLLSEPGTPPSQGRPRLSLFAFGCRVYTPLSLCQSPWALARRRLRHPGRLLCLAACCRHTLRLCSGACSPGIMGFDVAQPLRAPSPSQPDPLAEENARAGKRLNQENATSPTPRLREHQI